MNLEAQDESTQEPAEEAQQLFNVTLAQGGELPDNTVNCAANLFSTVLKVYFAISAMGDLYAFAVAVKFPPPFRGKYLGFLPPPRPALRPAVACWLISLLSWALDAPLAYSMLC